MIKTPSINLAEIAYYKPLIVSMLAPFFQEAERRDEPRGLRILYIDDSREKKDPWEGPRVALRLLKELGHELNGYRGTLSLFERIDDPRVLSNELIREAIPQQLTYSAGQLPSEQADLGLCIHTNMNDGQLAFLLGDGVRQGGLAFVHSIRNPPDHPEASYDQYFEPIRGSLSSTSDYVQRTHTMLLRRR